MFSHEPIDGSRARVLHDDACHFTVLLSKIGIQSGHATLRAEKRMNRSLITDAETVKHTSFSFGFNVEVPDSFCGHVRLLHYDSAVRAVALAH